MQIDSTECKLRSISLRGRLINRKSNVGLYLSRRWLKQASKWIPDRILLLVAGKGTKGLISNGVTSGKIRLNPDVEWLLLVQKREANILINIFRINKVIIRLYVRGSIIRARTSLKEIKFLHRNAEHLVGHPSYPEENFRSAEWLTTEHYFRSRNLTSAILSGK